jgi:hypothetical protein
MLHATPRCSPYERATDAATQRAMPEATQDALQ